MNARQKRFCEEYIIDLNAARAATTVGYSAKSAKVIGCKLLTKANLADYIQELMTKREKETGITAQVVLKELLLIAKTDIAAAYDEKGNLKPIHEIPEETRRAIAGIKVFEEFEGFGKERHKIGETRELKLWSKLDALELLGRHLKLFTDRVEHSFLDGLGERIAKSRKRMNE